MKRKAVNSESTISGLPVPEEISKEDQATAGMAAFIAICQEWDLTKDESRTLLGNRNQGRFDALRRGEQAALLTLSDEELDRLAYLSGIYAALGNLYAAHNHRHWLRNESRQPNNSVDRPWGQGSPLDYLLTGKLDALRDVHECLLSEMHGG